MGYLNWLHSDWKVFWHACSGNGLNEQCICIWNAYDEYGGGVFAYPVVKGGLEEIKKTFTNPNLTWDELIPTIDQWLKEMEELY